LLGIVGLVGATLPDSIKKVPSNETRSNGPQNFSTNPGNETSNEETQDNIHTSREGNSFGSSFGTIDYKTGDIQGEFKDFSGSSFDSSFGDK